VSALVVDTSSWISYFAGRGSGLIDEALTEGRVVLPAVVAAELLSGSLRARERARLEDFLSDLEVCPHDLSHWFRVGKFREELRRTGLSVSTPDAHVAQCALECDGLLLTEDSVFAKIARVKRLRLATI
jgi:predicted nucleic acid-binding protein